MPEWIWDKDPDTLPPTETEKPRYIWIDAAANFPDYADSRENIARDLAKIKETGFTDIVVDVRPTTGDVLFRSSVAEPAVKLDVWTDAGYTFYERTAGWDYLQAFIDAGHAVGLKVHASINTFVGGNRYPYGLGEQGLLFRDPAKKEWATVLSLETGLFNAMDRTDDRYGTKFLNPADDEVQAYLLSLIGELACYDLDGIFLDRCRYDDLASDFSEVSRKKFEAWSGRPVENFPGDVVTPGMQSSPLPGVLPPRFREWLEFRAHIIHDFVKDARARVKATRADIRFGVYVGGWYSTYYDSGVNWASPRYPAAIYFPRWASEGYASTGYAALLDFILIGAYAAPDRIEGSGEWTVQGFCAEAAEKLMGDVPFAGGVDVGNWSVPEGFTQADLDRAVSRTVATCLEAAGGYFVFDLVHVKQYDYWDELKAGIDAYLATETPAAGH